MIIIKATAVTKSFGEKLILNNLDFELKKKDRIGLIGYNGSGKTTLANLLSGTIKPDSGTIKIIQKSIKVGYLQQSIEYKTNDFQKMLAEEGEEGLYEMTSQLGLVQAQHWQEERLNHLSGGEKLKLALAKIWSSKPDVLILDEPTNHLDLDGIRWLKKNLDEFAGAVIIISHDRYFLDLAVNDIYELSAGKLIHYHGNYSDYRIEKEARYKTEMHLYEIQQHQKRVIENQIKQLKQWSDKAHRDSTKKDGIKEYYRVKAKKKDSQIKSKTKRLEVELDKNKAEKPLEEQSVFFHFTANEKRGKRILEGKGASKAFDNRLLFKDSYFYVKQGEKIAILGSNGVGKTTLVKIILGEETLTGGELWKSDSLKIAYLSQDVHDLPVDKKPLDALSITDRTDIFKATTMFAHLGMDATLLQQPISNLSLGQRTRVKLVGMLLMNHDILILDEPTNHLDLPSREQLEDTLSLYEGTLIVISHDHYLIKKLCNKLLVFDNKNFRRMDMGLEAYEQKQVEKQKMVDDNEEELMRIETRLAEVLGKLSMLLPSDKQYAILDEEFKQLLSRKNKIRE